MNADVFVVQHRYELNDCDEIKLIGVYSSQEAAEQAVARTSIEPGFRDHPNDFFIDRCTLDKDHWAEGFKTMTYEREPGVKGERPVKVTLRPLTNDERAEFLGPCSLCGADSTEEPRNWRIEIRFPDDPELAEYLACTRCRLALRELSEVLFSEAMTGLLWFEGDKPYYQPT